MSPSSNLTTILSSPNKLNIMYKEFVIIFKNKKYPITQPDIFNIILSTLN